LFSEYANLEKEMLDAEIEDKIIFTRSQYSKNIFEEQREFFINMKAEKQNIIEENIKINNNHIQSNAYFSYHKIK